VFLAVLDSDGVGLGVEDALDGQPGGGGGVADQFDDGLVGGEGSAAPVEGDLGEQSVFDLVPLAGARWQVANGDRQPGFGGEPGQLDLPGPDPAAVGSAGVGADQQPVGVRVAVGADGVPPASQGLHRERGGVVVGADRHPSVVGGDVVDAVGDGLAEGG